MTKRSVTISGVLLLVLFSLLLVSMACYSGQLGLFELTPYYTPTPVPVAEDAQFKVFETVLAPVEPGRTFFHLTVFPEPIQGNLMNSRATCQGDSPATVLYAGRDHGEVYYLVDCVGSVGWVSEKRLSGPLKFARDDLAIALAAEGSQTVPLLDDTLRPVPPNPLQSCKPETIVTVTQIQAVDPDGDGTKSLFYQIDCPTPAGPVKGWLLGTDLFGPLEANIDERALAVGEEGVAPDPDTPFPLVQEPVPVTEGTTVEGDCFEGDVLQVTEARMADDNVYYGVTCGSIEGWVDQSRFVGPLLYDTGTKAVIFVPAVPIYEDELLAMQAAEAATGEPVEGEAPVAEGEAPVAEGEASPEGETEATERKVVEYVPPLYLTENPGAAVTTGEGVNVVGMCESGMVAALEEYAALDTVYYRIQCDECVESETDVDGVTTCTAFETRDGWVPQSDLQGPLQFAPGEKAVVKSSSKAIETTDDGTKYVRIPANQEGAASIGQFTAFAGRCPVDAELEITGVLLEKARTSSAFAFYYEVTCTGQPAVVTTVMVNNRERQEYSYDAEKTETITGVMSARDVQAVGQ